MIRLAAREDLPQLLQLYTHLHDNALPEMTQGLWALWERMLADENYCVLVAQQGEELLSSCVLVLAMNLTHDQRPYAWIENVVTHAAHRKKGHATAVLEEARRIAVERGCYKIMLMTSAKDAATLRFYEKAGFNKHDKTAFVQWLE